MKNILLGLIILSISLTFPITSNGQSKMSEYKPLNKNEMLLLPRLKSQKYDANMGKLIDLVQKMGNYMEVNETDELYYYQFEKLANEIKAVASGDLAEKDTEVQKLDFKAQKIIRDFESREREGVTMLQIKNGAQIYSKPYLPTEDDGSRYLGRYTKDHTFLNSEYNSRFYKVVHRGNFGFVSKDDVYRR